MAALTPGVSFGAKDGNRAVGRSLLEEVNLMKKFAVFAFAASAALALAACGSSESAKEEAQPDNVEMPAEEAVPDSAGTPVADTSAGADAGSAELGTSGDPRP